MCVCDYFHASLDVQNIFFLLDTSGSMTGKRIDQLNNGIRSSLEAIQKIAADYNVKVTVRVAEFNDHAQWMLGRTEEGVDIDDAIALWTPLEAIGCTNTAAAIRLARECMHIKYLGEHAYPPVVILVTDGYSNSFFDTQAAIEELQNSMKSKRNPSKDRMIRIAVGVVSANQTELEMFASVGTIIDEKGIHEAVPLVFDVNNAKTLANLLFHISTSSVVSNITTNGDENIVINAVGKNEIDEDGWDT